MRWYTRTNINLPKVNWNRLQHIPLANYEGNAPFLQLVEVTYLTFYITRKPSS